MYIPFILRQNLLAIFSLYTSLHLCIFCVLTGLRYLVRCIAFFPLSLSIIYLNEISCMTLLHLIPIL